MMSNEIYPPHLLAKKLNNRAALLITKQSYDESIALLSRALKLTEHAYENTAAKCNHSLPECNSVNLDSCVTMEQESYLSLLDKEENGGYKKIENNVDIERRHQHSIDWKKAEQTNEKLVSQEESFLYSNPLLVPKCCIEEDCYMGIVLTLMILFNLSLAHHLKAVATNDSERCNKILDQALKLYELTYQLHISSDQSVGSLRFTMIIANNLGQIHKLAGNAEKHQLCLQHLLSVIMYMIDSFGLHLDSRDMDGFYQNVLPIMVSEHCAKAA